MLKAIYLFVAFAFLSGCSIINPQDENKFLDGAYSATETAKEVVDGANEVAPNPIFYGASAVLGGLLALLGFAGGKIGKKTAVEALKKSAIMATVAIAKREQEDETKNNEVKEENDSKEVQNGNS